MADALLVSPALRTCVLASVRRRGRARFGEVYRDVVDDFGRVSLRQVHRAVRLLRLRRRLRVLGREDGHPLYSVGQ